MVVEHSGWSEDRGFFCDEYSVDISKTDMTIKWKDGRESKQVIPFQNIENDWNNDDDVYELLGATFEDDMGRSFYTPNELVGLIIDDKAEIDGIRRI